MNRASAVVKLFSAAVVVGCVGAATADASPVDSAFIRVLDEEGITYTSVADAIRAGHAVCDYLDLGYSLMDAAEFVADASGLGYYQSGYFVGASTAAYCSWYLDVGNQPVVLR